MSEPWYFANHRLDHARGLIAAGFDVHVATRRGDRFDEIAEAGCTMHVLAVDRGSSWTALAPLGDSRTPQDRACKPPAYRARRGTQTGCACHVTHRAWRRPALILSVNGLGISDAESSRGLTAFRTVLGVVGRLPRVELLFQTMNDRCAVVGNRTTGTLVPGVGVDLERFSPSTDLDDGPPFRVVVPRSCCPFEGPHRPGRRCTRPATRRTGHRDPRCTAHSTKAVLDRSPLLNSPRWRQRRRSPSTSRLVIRPACWPSRTLRSCRLAPVRACRSSSSSRSPAPPRSSSHASRAAAKSCETG